MVWMEVTGGVGLGRTVHVTNMDALVCLAQDGDQARREMIRKMRGFILLEDEASSEVLVVIALQGSSVKGFSCTGAYGTKQQIVVSSLAPEFIQSYYSTIPVESTQVPIMLNGSAEMDSNHRPIG